MNTKGERAGVHVADTLDEEIPYDLVLVTLQAHQVDAVLAGLQRSAAKWIQFMFNNFDPERLRDAIGAERCSFGMPFVQATVDRNGRLNAKIGAAGQKSKMNHQGWVRTFIAAGLPAVFEPEMLLWLRCHVPVGAAFESVCVAGMRRGGGASWSESLAIARGMQETPADSASRVPALSCGKVTAPREPGIDGSGDAVVYVAHPFVPGASLHRSKRVSRTGGYIAGEYTSRNPACFGGADSSDETVSVNPPPRMIRRMSSKRKRIDVRGVVQGVGFRPFVYKLATSLSLTGFVFNSSVGVTIEVEGSGPALDEFLQTLRDNPPQLAEIASIRASEIDVQGCAGFAILNSREEAGGFALIPADCGTCDACWRDFGDPANRRFGYPFTNCIHCGPRYTIIRELPYDRATTTMSAFTMCAACQAEYDDPGDRRFHAQPNACAMCGPSLTLTGFPAADSLSILHQTRTLLRQGRIVAVKGLGGFLLACDAANDVAVAELRRRKRRPHKPFAVMARDLPAVRKLCTITSEEEAALLHPRRPIVILPRAPGSPISEDVAPNERTLGVMLPYTPLHYLLFSDSHGEESEWAALVMTSGNLSEEPIVIDNDEAVRRLGKVADCFLLHNRDIATRVDDSVVRLFEGRERVLRRARGFAPQTIDLGTEMAEILAYGAELKNTFCLTKGRDAILSQHIGDLENYETMRFFAETLDLMKHVFRVAPRAVAYDLHPGYLSTRMALAATIERKIGVQHHHAHIASCMAENHLRGQVLGVAMDGTGFGTDGKIWGGEFLVADFAGFTRRAHLRNVLLPGGDAAVRQPWRMALSYLRDAFGHPASTFQGVDDNQVALVNTMLARGIQTVETSSCGRLFDAVAAMLGLAREVTFEGQAAIALEAAVEPGIDDSYDFSFDEEEVDFRPVIVAIARDISSGRQPGEISACFHNTLSAAIGEVCGRIRASDGVDRVCLSGGSFQNLYLLRRTVVELRQRGLAIFLHAQVPANDGGLSLGQAMVANERLRRGE